MRCLQKSPGPVLARTQSAPRIREPSLRRRILWSLLFAVGLGISAGLGGNWGDVLGQTAGPPPTLLTGLELTALPEIAPPPADEFRAPTVVGRGPPLPTTAAFRPAQMPNSIAPNVNSPDGAGSPGAGEVTVLPEPAQDIDSAERLPISDISQSVTLSRPALPDLGPSSAPGDSAMPAPLVVLTAVAVGGAMMFVLAQRHTRR